MFLRAKFVASLAFATSAFVLAPAAAQAAPHPVQVTGSKLKSALLPASAFGPGFKLENSTSSGNSLWHQPATDHAPTMSCENFEGTAHYRYGESAVAVNLSLNLDATSFNANIAYSQEVYQFPSAKAAATFYHQAHAKFASCKSFSGDASGDPGGGGKITLTSIAKTKVGKYQAFRLTQNGDIPGPPAILLKVNILVTVAGADVFIVINVSGTKRPVPAKTMLKLVNRVVKLR